MTKKKPVAISVHNLHKNFTLPQSKNTSLKQSFVNIVKKNNKVTQKVLDGISFDIEEGDFFGIVGRNGSGKSTLLKILAGVYYPTAGKVKINGGLTPFIELGVGFNPELSGRDNVYLNGALLGFTRSQMDEMYDEIVDFAELGPFMDQKLKNYSSGMQVRLAFSIAIKAKNEILVFDEVLAVGDEAFQRKCLDVFEKYKADGQTVVLVTHAMETVKKYCNKAILISDGKIIESGNPHKVADVYSKENLSELERDQLDSLGEGFYIETKNSKTNKDTSIFEIGESMDLHIHWPKEAETKILMVDIFKLTGEHVTGFKSKNAKHRIKGSEAVVKIKNDLTPGKYYFKIGYRKKQDSDFKTLYKTGEFRVPDKWPDDITTWSGSLPIQHEWVK